MNHYIDETSNYKLFLKIAKELNKLYASRKKSLPYSVNVISELHANENANSRILRGLLQYSHNGKYPIFQKFIECIHLHMDCELGLVIKNPEFTNEENRIDLLIKEKKTYAIIIENKIWDAVDQEAQIERYVDYVDGLAIPRKKIFTIYLTSDGSKEVSDRSLTDKAKKYLGCTNKNNGRFICINFKEHIIPWLDELTNDTKINNEPLLLSAITQYCDYLKECFDLRKEDIEIENELEKQLMEKLQIQNLQELLQTRNDVDKLQEIVSSTIDNKILGICENKICKSLKKKGYIIKSYEFSYNKFLLEIEVPNWKKCWWVMENEDTKLFSGIWRNPKERVYKKDIAMLKDVYNESVGDYGYIGWNWHDDYELNDEFWINLEVHSVKFVNFIISEIERVKEATRNIKL